MPNHIHFLIQIKTEAELISTFSNLRGFKNLEGLSVEEIETVIEKRISKQFGNLFNSYTKAFNKMDNRRGSLFISNFKREEITSDNYFTNIIHYIHANPVHHGFVKSIGDWPWSSYYRLSTGEPTTLINAESIWNWFGGREEFIHFHQRPIQLKNGFSDFIQEQ
jgi:putative transposase